MKDKTKNAINLPQIKEDDSITPFVQDGEWTTPTLLPILIEQIPNAEIRISSFKISEEALRNIALHGQKAKSIHLMLDRSLLRTKVEKLYFASNITPNVATNNIHAKIILIHNDQKRIGIVSSQNFNETKKIEAGFYFSDKKTYQYFLNQYDNYYAKSIRFSLG